MLDCEEKLITNYFHRVPTKGRPTPLEKRKRASSQNKVSTSTTKKKKYLSGQCSAETAYCSSRSSLPLPQSLHDHSHTISQSVSAQYRDSNISDSSSPIKGHLAQLDNQDPGPSSVTTFPEITQIQERISRKSNIHTLSPSNHVADTIFHGSWPDKLRDESMVTVLPEPDSHNSHPTSDAIACSQDDLIVDSSQSQENSGAGPLYRSNDNNRNEVDDYGDDDGHASASLLDLVLSSQSQHLLSNLKHRRRQLREQNTLKFNDDLEVIPSSQSQEKELGLLSVFDGRRDYEGLSLALLHAPSFSTGLLVRHLSLEGPSGRNADSQFNHKGKDNVTPPCEDDLRDVSLASPCSVIPSAASAWHNSNNELEFGMENDHSSTTNVDLSPPVPPHQSLPPELGDFHVMFGSEESYPPDFPMSLRIT